MSVRTLIYWLIPIILTVAGLVYGWPGETPTFTRKVWLPDPEVQRDPTLVNQWLQHPAGPWGLDDFKEKSERGRYKSVWILTTPLVDITKPAYWPSVSSPGNSWQVLYLGRQGSQTIESVTVDVGSQLSPLETWTRPIGIGAVEIEGQNLTIRTIPDGFYPFKLAAILLVVGLAVDVILGLNYGNSARRYFLQNPVRLPVVVRVLAPAARTYYEPGSIHDPDTNGGLD